MRFMNEGIRFVIKFLFSSNIMVRFMFVQTILDFSGITDVKGKVKISNVRIPCTGFFKCFPK